MKLICAFVFTYAKSRFSHDVAQLNITQVSIVFCIQNCNLKLGSIARQDSRLVVESSKIGNRRRDYEMRCVFDDNLKIAFVRFS